MAPLAAPAPALRCRGADLLDETGAVVKLKGINWFGFNTGTTMVDGLWGSDPLVTDFAAVVLRQKLLGAHPSVISMSPRCQHMQSGYVALCTCRVWVARFLRTLAITAIENYPVSATATLFKCWHRPEACCAPCLAKVRSAPAGFNAVRLPFSFRDLHDLPPRSFANGIPRPSDDEVAASVLPPGAQAEQDFLPLLFALHTST